MSELVQVVVGYVGLWASVAWFASAAYANRLERLARIARSRPQSRPATPRRCPSRCVRTGRPATPAALFPTRGAAAWPTTT